MALFLWLDRVTAFISIRFPCRRYNFLSLNKFDVLYLLRIAVVKKKQFSDILMMCYLFSQLTLMLVVANLANMR